MKKINYILATRHKKTVYKILLTSVKIHAEKKLRSKLELKYFEYDNFITIKSICFIIYAIIIGKLFLNRKFITLRYKDFVIGRYILSNCYRKTIQNNSKIKFLIAKIKDLFKSISIISSLERLNGSIKAVYIDHGMYLNGIIIQYFTKKKVLIYTNNFPKGLVCFDLIKFPNSNKQIQYEDLIRISSKKEISQKKILMVRKNIKKIINSPTLLPWMNSANFKKLKKNYINFNKVTHIVYSHSFLENEYMFGFDGFLTYKDWLIVTLSELVKNSRNVIIVKGHPNFYTKNFSKINYLDTLIFKGIIRKFKKCPNIIFINYPVKNIDLLNMLSKQTIIITRHSTVIFESILLGFKVIFSRANVWNVKKFEINNYWNSIKSYKLLLNKNWSQLSYSNLYDFFLISYQLFCNQKYFNGNNFWDKVVADYYDINRQIVAKDKVPEKLLNKGDSLNKVSGLLAKDSISVEKIIS